MIDSISPPRFFPFVCFLNIFPFSSFSGNKDYLISSIRYPTTHDFLYLIPIFCCFISINLFFRFYVYLFLILVGVILFQIPLYFLLTRISILASVTFVLVYDIAFSLLPGIFLKNMHMTLHGEEVCSILYFELMLICVKIGRNLDDSCPSQKEEAIYPATPHAFPG